MTAGRQDSAGDEPGSAPNRHEEGGRRMLSWKTLQLHPLVVLSVITGGTLLFGIFGAILAAPVTAVTLKASAELKAAGVFSEQPSLERAGRWGRPGKLNVILVYEA